MDSTALGGLVAVRSATPRPLVGKGNADADELPARGRLATDLANLVDAGQIELVSGFRIQTVEPAGGRIRLVGDQLLDDDLAAAKLLRVAADEVVTATGSDPTTRSRPSCGWPWIRPWRARPRLGHSSTRTCTPAAPCPPTAWPSSPTPTPAM